MLVGDAWPKLIPPTFPARLVGLQVAAFFRRSPSVAGAAGDGAREAKEAKRPMATPYLHGGATGSTVSSTLAAKALRAGGEGRSLGRFFQGTPVLLEEPRTSSPGSAEAGAGTGVLAAAGPHTGGSSVVGGAFFGEGDSPGLGLGQGSRPTSFRSGLGGLGGGSAASGLVAVDVDAPNRSSRRLIAGSGVGAGAGAGTGAGDGGDGSEPDRRSPAVPMSQGTDMHNVAENFLLKVRVPRPGPHVFVSWGRTRRVHDGCGVLRRCCCCCHALCHPGWFV